MRSWRTSRAGVAPIDRRIEISRCRAVARESSKFATFAQTMRSCSMLTIDAQETLADCAEVVLEVIVVLAWLPELDQERAGTEVPRWRFVDS